MKILCWIGLHGWPEWRTDEKDGFWSSCRVCYRCYKVDLVTGRTKKGGQV